MTASLSAFKKPFHRSNLLSNLKSVKKLLFYVYITTRRALCWCWIQINIFVAQPDRLLLKNRVHKCLVVGDGLAQGMGDASVICGGVAGISSTLQTCAHLDSSVKMKWQFVNRGDYSSNSQDWLPPSPKHISKGGKHYEKIFGDGGVGKDAECVIVLLGTKDLVQQVEELPLEALQRDLGCASYPNHELARLVQNVGRLVKELQKQGKRVCVLDWPTSGVPHCGRGKLRRLNMQLRQIVSVTNAETTSNHKMEKHKEQKKQFCPIKLVKMGNNHRLMRPEFRAFDSLHFNAKGYKLLALDLFQNGGVKNMLVHAEFHGVWKAQLASGQRVGGS